MIYFLPIGAHQDDAISLKDMNLELASVGEPSLDQNEASDLNRLLEGKLMAWNRFIELLLMT
jgi:hypothetical protein